MAGRPKIFFGYPSDPRACGETVSAAVNELNKTGVVEAQTWEALRTPGRLLIEKVLSTIDASDVCAFDVTSLNHNVMFELGYVIGAGKKMWLLLDESNSSAGRLWREIKMLTTIEFSPYVNSRDIVSEFWKSRPHEHGESILDGLIHALTPPISPAIFAVPSIHATDADRRLRKCLHDEQRNGASVFVADPTESGVQPLSWYAERVYASHATIVHLCSEERTDWRIHNARGSLVAGLARGMGRVVLMVAESGHEYPIDYQDLLRPYDRAADLEECITEWLSAQMLPIYGDFKASRDQRAATKLAVELRSLRLGEHVAENERETLPQYFVRTTPFEAVLEKKAVIFVGRKGSGKTANLLEASRELNADARNLVTVIQPPSYELESVVQLLRDYYERAEHGFLVESLWKFLIYSEIAQSIFDDIEGRGIPPQTGTPEDLFLVFFRENQAVLHDDFAVRLESVVDAVRTLPKEGGVGQKRLRISEALHDGLIKKLRRHLGQVLSGRNRVAVLIDNLDKAWSKSSEIEHLALFLLGLLQSIERIADDFGKDDHWRSPVTVTLAVFLRTDIYEYVSRAAREPDKLPIQSLAWTDPEQLLRVVEERFLANQPANTHPSRLWTEFFCEQVNGIPASDYIMEHVLPRPRDLVQFCNAAIGAAVNHRHTRVESRDVLAGEAAYSQFAFESLKVENGVSLEEIENVLYEFVGKGALISRSEVRQTIQNAGISEAKLDDVLRHLVARTFLGPEVNDGEFRFVYELSDLPIVESLERVRARGTRYDLRYKIHPAFHSYLEVDRSVV